jgi:hypothetical protein
MYIAFHITIVVQEDQQQVIFLENIDYPGGLRDDVMCPNLTMIYAYICCGITIRIDEDTQLL